MVSFYGRIGSSRVLHYIGVTTTTLVDGSTTSTITIDETSYIAKPGDVVVYDGMVLGFNGDTWQTFGSATVLKVNNTVISNT